MKFFEKVVPRYPIFAGLIVISTHRYMVSCAMMLNQLCAIIIVYSHSLLHNI